MNIFSKVWSKTKSIFVKQQTFSSSGTWVKLAGAQFVHVITVGAGGGGGYGGGKDPHRGETLKQMDKRMGLRAPKRKRKKKTKLVRR